MIANNSDEFRMARREVIGLLRRDDWQASVLGNPRYWPARLQHLVEVLLNSRTAGFVVCGPQRIVIYNGAFAQLLDARHPATFGLPFAEAFPEAVEALNHFDNAFNGEPDIIRGFSWPIGSGEVQSSRLFDIELTPVTDDKCQVSWVQGRVTMKPQPGGIATDLVREFASTAGQLSEMGQVQQSEERLRLALDVARLAIWDWDVKSGKVIWSDEHFRMTGYAIGEVEPSFQRWTERVHPQDLAATLAKIDYAREKAEPYLHEFRFQHPDGRIVWTSAFGRFFFDESAQAERMVGVMYDITEQRSASQRQQIVLSELQHRSRNLIGLIESIARKTLMRAASMEDFAVSLGHRLSALARVQAFTAQIEQGRGVTFRELLLSELSAHGVLLEDGEVAERITLKGEPDVYLSPDMVQTFALALHELATNATKYGAFKEQGHLLVEWYVEETERPGETLFSFKWLETGVETRGADSPTISGYGRELIERALPYQLGATTQYEIGVGIVRCTVTLPIYSDRLAPTTGE